jgi:integrase
MKEVSSNSVLHYHAIIHSALRYAVKTDMIPSNPADKIDRPRKGEFIPDYYNLEEMTQLFEALKGHKLELPCLVAAFYGLRRAEIVGLRWDAIDFEKDTITVKHTVAEIKLDGKKQLIEQNTAKTKSSLRTLPLIGQFKEYFQKVKES